VGLLESRTAVVTGAGRNVGESVAVALAAEGAHVYLVDNSQERAERVLARIEAGGAGSAAVAICDVGSWSDVAGVAERVGREAGGLDVLVNNVALGDRGHSILDEDVELFDAVVRTSLKSVYLMCRHLAPLMVSSGGGSIVNVGSTSALKPRANAIAYPTSKAGVMAMTRSMAVQLGSHGIRVNTVTPNKVGPPIGQDVEVEHRERTNLVGRACEPEDVADAVMYLVSEAGSFVTGTDILVDGGSLLLSGG
jgi:NAD(P)-dependent dehydrogenase (short-subunit alcohol dehydrogenase family)